MSLKTRLITLTALGLLVLVAFSGALPAAHAQSSPSVAVSLSDASVEQGTAITATMSFRGLTFDSDTSTTDYTFRADVTGANDCEGGGLGRTRYMYRVDQDPEVRSGTISASCPAGDYTIRATISTPQSVELASATASFTVAAPAQEPTASPTASIALSPSDAVGEGAEITATMSFGGLASDSDASTTDYVFRADVVDADDCEGGGIGKDRYMYRVDQDPETRTGTISADCPAGAYTLRVSISSSDNTELASASASFFILGAPVLIEPPTLTALSVSHGDPAVDVTLSPAFESGTLAYRAAVKVAQVTVAPTAGDADATVAYLDGNGDAIADADAGADGHQVGLDAGSNTVKVAVSKDSLTTTYTVKLLRLVTQQQNSDVTLVSNTGQDDSSSTNVGANTWVQSFTTGSNSGGYNLSSIEVVFHGLSNTRPTSSEFTVTIWSATSADPPLPDAVLHTLTTPDTFTANAVNTFTAPANTVLAASTTYFVRLNNTSNASVTVMRTTSHAEDSGAAAGWSIGNKRYYRPRSLTGTSGWSNSNNVFKFAVKGSAVGGGMPPPQSSDATLSALTLVNAADDAAITLTPTFVSGTESYTADVASAVAKVTVTATPTHAEAEAVITPTDADSVLAGHQVNMGTPGSDTVITVVVTAEDGSDKTYTVTVTRAAAVSAVTLVSNTGQAATSRSSLSNSEWLQAFTTGSNTGGYNLSSIELDIDEVSTGFTSSDFMVTIWSATDADPPLPDSQLHTLSTPSAVTTGIVAFSASSIVLNASTTYFVRVSNALLNTPVYLNRTRSLAEDSGGAAGWSIGNKRYYRGIAQTSPFTSSSILLKFAVKGSAAATTNSAATGEPTISGTNLVGQTLTANKGTIADTDGLPLESTFTYQWIRVSSGSEDDISGATSKTYTTVSADQGKKLKVTVGFTDNASNAESRTSSRSEIIGATTCTPTAPAAAIWSACLTVDVGGYYFEDTGVPDNYGALSNPEFTVDGTTYTFDTLQTFTTSLFLIFTTAPGNAASDWVLHVGSASTSFAFSAATLSDAGKQYRWSNAGLTWSGGDVISVWIAVAAAQSTDATLSALSLVNAADDAAITLTPTFVSGTEPYAASVASGVAQVTVTATPTHAEAEAVITPTDADSVLAGHQVNMGTPGSDTVITVVVTAEDGSDKTYTVTVTRAAPTLVSNTGQTAASAFRVGANEWFQSFTTGSNAGGYNLSSIELDFSTAPSELTSSNFTVSIWSATAADPPLPNALLHTLSSPSAYTTGIVAFSASSVELDATTTYFVLVRSTITTNLNRTASAAEDSGAAPGWSIGNTRYTRVRETLGNLRTSHTLLKLAVKGTQTPQSATPVLALDLDPDTIDEDAGTAVNVTATALAAQATEFTVTVAAAAVYPATDAAYKLSANTTLTFAALATESTGTVTITPVGNTVNELDKVITVSGTVAGITGVTGPDDVTLTITDDDHPVINHILTLHRDDAAKTLLDPTMIPENVGQVCMKVTATTEAGLPPERNDTVAVSSRSDTAKAPGDYPAVSEVLYLPVSIYSFSNRRYGAFRYDCTALRIEGDSVDEDNEQFTMLMQSGLGTPDTYRYEQSPTNPLVVTIIDDDPEPSLRIADAGGAEGEDLEFTVTLDPASGRDVTVDWAVDDGTATAGDDYTAGSGTLTFAPGDTTKTVTVAALQDTDPEDAETFTVTLSNARNATIADAEATGTIAASDGFTKSFQEPVCPAQWVTESQYEENPTGCPRLTLVDFGTVKVDWDDVPDAVAYTTRYYMDVDGVAKWYTNADPYPGVNRPAGGESEATYSNLPREANIVYFSFRSQFLDAPHSSDWSPYSLISINDPLELEGAAPAPDDVLDQTPASGTPGKPVLSAVPSSANGGRAALSWTGSSNSPTGYEVLVEYSSGEGVNRIIITLESATTNYTYATLREGARRTFRVRGVNANSAGHWSEPTVFVADREDASYPRMPKGFTAYPRPNGQVEMSWHDPDAGDGVTGYRIVRVAGWDEMMDHRGFPVDGVTVVTTSRNSVATTYTESGLTANTEYRYAVQWIKAAATPADDVYSALSFIYRVKTNP